MYMTKAITEIQGSASSRKHRMHFQKQSFVLFVGCAKCLSSDSILESFRSIQSIFLFFKKFADKVFAKEVNYESFITCHNSKGCWYSFLSPCLWNFLTNLIACIVFYGFAHILKGLALDLWMYARTSLYPGLITYLPHVQYMYLQLASSKACCCCNCWGVSNLNIRRLIKGGSY